MPETSSRSGSILRALAASAVLAPWLGAASAAALPPGTEALSEIQSLVVVYPARPEAEAAVNALSAARRAGFLEHLFGVDAQPVADDALTEEHLHRHLLVLGWDNRVMEHLGDRRPFRRDGEDRVFLDGVRLARGEDLMFSVVSPHDAERRLFFWSRIDLDLDKFSVLPFLGSDWAVYRGYEVVRQGMLREHGAWPLARNPLAESIAGDFRAGYPVQGSSEHYSVHFPPGLVDEAERAAILAAREQALSAAAKFLAVPTEGVRIELFLFADAETKERLTGVPDPVHSLGRDQELHMLTAHARSPDPHEETHLLAYRRLGPCYHTALHEGLPLALERASGDTTLSTYAAAMVATDGVPSIETLLDEDGVRSLNQGQIGFPASGLFVSFILDRGGLELLGRLYRREPLTAAALAAELDSAPGGIEASYKGWVEARAKEGEPEYRFQRAVADAAMAGQKDDWPAAVEHLTRALELRPTDADTLYRLALAEDKAGLPAAAEKHLRRLLELAAGDAFEVAERYVIFGHYQLGRMLERQGHTDAAKEEFRRVLAMPDRHGSHRMAMEALGPAEAASGGT